MSYISNLDEFQKDILNDIVSNYKVYINQLDHSTYQSETSMFLSYLMYDTLKRNNYQHVVEMYLATYKDSAQINLEIVYNTPLMENEGILDLKKQIKSITNTTKFRLIKFLDFIFKLYSQGLVVFSNEEEEQTEYRAWVKADYKLCKAKGYTIETTYFCSSELKNIVDKYYCSAIIPTQTLIDLVDNQYLSNDDIKFIKSQRLGKLGIISSFIIAILSPWLMTKCSYTKIDNTQFDKMIISSHITDSINELHNNVTKVSQVNKYQLACL